jgi:Tol biopolymer transport system component
MKKNIQHTLQALILLTLPLLGVVSCAPRHEGKQAAAIAYPEPTPDSVAIPFLPGVVSKDSLDFNAAFSADGKSYYFTRSENKKLIIYASTHDGTRWTEPVPAAFTEAGYSQADPAFGPDGKLYFISNKPRHAADTLDDYDIWFVTPQDKGWSAPQNLAAINTDSAEYYISFTDKGNLYFASARAGGYGQEDIYVSELVNGAYAQPRNLGAAINTDKSEYDPGISPAEDMIVFASSRRADSYGAADLYGAKRSTQGEWTTAMHLGKTINTDTRDYCPYFSPDGRYFFFSSERNVKWIGIGAFQQAWRP